MPEEKGAKDHRGDPHTVISSAVGGVSGAVDDGEYDEDQKDEEKDLDHPAHIPGVTLGIAGRRRTLCGVQMGGEERLEGGEHPQGEGVVIPGHECVVVLVHVLGDHGVAQGGGHAVARDQEGVLPTHVHYQQQVLGAETNVVAELIGVGVDGHAVGVGHCGHRHDHTVTGVPVGVIEAQRLLCGIGEHTGLVPQPVCVAGGVQAGVQR